MPLLKSDGAGYHGLVAMGLEELPLYALSYLPRYVQLSSIQQLHLLFTYLIMYSMQSEISSRINPQHLEFKRFPRCLQAN